MVPIVALLCILYVRLRMQVHLDRCRCRAFEDGPKSELYANVSLSFLFASILLSQLAYRRLHGRVANTYEAATTAGFRHGRTETLRSTTADSCALVDFLLDKSASASASSPATGGRSSTNKQEVDLAGARSLLARCKSTHSQLTKEALTGALSHPPFHFSPLTLAHVQFSSRLFLHSSPSLSCSLVVQV